MAWVPAPSLPRMLTVPEGCRTALPFPIPLLVPPYFPRSLLAGKKEPLYQVQELVALERMVEEDGEGEGSLTNGNTTKPYCLSTYCAPQSEPRSEETGRGGGPGAGEMLGPCKLSVLTPSQSGRGKSLESISGAAFDTRSKSGSTHCNHCKPGGAGTTGLPEKRGKVGARCSMQCPTNRVLWRDCVVPRPTHAKERNRLRIRRGDE